jgi:glycosyltransferase involved in cell wall biosynthesis
MSLAANAHARSLAGATIVQVVPSLREGPSGNTAVNIAFTLLQSGARAVIAGDDGPLVNELRAFGGEFVPMPNDTLNPLCISRNASALSKMIASERVDIVHAQSVGAAWSALAATYKQPVHLVTSFPDRLPSHSYLGSMLRPSLSRGNRVIAPSAYVSRAIIERYKLAADRVSVIPHTVDTAKFSPAAVSADRIAALRRAWAVLPEARIVLVPGRLAPWNGQMSVIDAALLILGGGERNIMFIFVGDDRAQPRYAYSIRQQANLYGIEMLCRFVSHCPDKPAALAAADVVVVPAIEPPLSARTAAEAQAMGRPLVTTAVGALTESLLCPPRMPDELRTGWLVRPGNAGDIALAVGAALALNRTAYEALRMRARQYAEFMFSPQSIAEAIRGVYASLLARNP